jgi:hypothetical protein
MPRVEELESTLQDMMDECDTLRARVFELEATEASMMDECNEAVARAARLATDLAKAEGERDAAHEAEQ